MNQQAEDFLKSLYLNPTQPASYQGPQKLFAAVQRDGRFRLTYEQIKKWVRQFESYSLNQRIKKNFQRNRVTVTGIDAQWDIDLASFIPYADENDGFKYLFCAIDIFSRYAWVETMKDKSGTNVIPAFRKILADGRKPRTVRSDAGKEFTSIAFTTFMKREKINFFTTHNDTQANYVERFIKTIKNKIFRYMTDQNTSRYVDILPDLVKSYNHSFHSGVQMEPINVNRGNEKKLYWQMYWPRTSHSDAMRKHKNRRFTFEVGDKVRISKTKRAFDREYSERWSREIFQIKSRFFREDIPVYRIEDWFNDLLKGSFYQSELQKVESNAQDLFDVEEILDYKGRGRNRQALVKWKGWPKKFNSWQPASNVVHKKSQTKTPLTTSQRGRQQAPTSPPQTVQLSPEIIQPVPQNTSQGMTLRKRKRKN